MYPFFLSAKQVIAFGLLFLASQASLIAQSALSDSGVQDDPDFFVTLDAFVMYGGDIEVIDGLTGKAYHSDYKVVKTIHENFPKIMGGLHNLLLDLEIKHMNYQLVKGAEQERQLIELLESFGVKNFELDRSTWLRREKAILARLQSEPFFQIKNLVIWEKEELDPINLPINKYARHIRYNSETSSWERRILTEWNVSTPGRKNWHHVLKYQGLNLETNKGFHIIRDHGLSGNVHPNDFKEVPVSFPIIISRKQDPDTQIDRLQRLIVQNLSHLYDPFTWIGRRNVRFHGIYLSTLKKHFEERRRFKVADRDWFDPVMCSFFNDVATLRVRGLGEIYGFYLTQRFESAKNELGEGLDLLNWNLGEKRKGAAGAKKDGRIWINFKNPGGARFIMLDLYLRYGDKFLNSLRSKLTQIKGRTSGRALIEEAIAEVSGMPHEKYIKAATKAQIAGINKFRESKAN